MSQRLHQESDDSAVLQKRARPVSTTAGHSQSGGDQPAYKRKPEQCHEVLHGAQGVHSTHVGG